ncbi:type IV secretion system DNA-binding domain-containing protein [Geomonas paludis]|uniref:Type IV secretion system DNA-binding domain-containing protein n=1 Tax=Geomonas paludis TaxID=2740185 RepID=A0ABY4LMX2_9BACT|nr:type IV secretion system DNA-binding domain-containing protein [Geomonas paludis]UPU37867.1 type IV secretion system DNA-binding domain-containing protein [Geomonas paludis]
MDKNSYQGYEVQKHRLMMTVKMFFQISAFCLALQTLFFLLAFKVPRWSIDRTAATPGRPGAWIIRNAERVPGVYREFLWKYPVAHLVQSVRLNPTFHIYAPGRLVKWPHDADGYVSMRAQEILRNVDYRQVLKAYRFPFFCSFLGWICVWPAALWYVRRTTTRIKEQEHIRGARLVTEEAISSETDASAILPIASILIPEALSRRHILIAGQTGSGKSTVLIQHIAAIQKAKRRAIVNDFKGELVERFYRPEKDLILNPIDARGVGWTLFNELKSKPDLTAITGSLIPPAKGEDRFWSAAAQDVLRGVMAYCYENNKRTNVELWKALTSPLNQITEMCRGTESGHAGYTYIQDASSKQAAGVIAVLMSYVSWLEFAFDGPFSLRQWAEEGGDKMIFITNTDEVSNIMRPYLSLFADLAGKRFLTLPDTSESMRNIYLILDELGNMQRLPSVKRLLTAGRSKGIVVEIGIPDFTSIESVYGREDAHTIINSCGSKLVLNLGDPEAARFFSDLASEEECWESSTDYSISEHDHRGGENHNRQVRTRKVIMPAEIMRLPVGTGYFMLPGGNPAKVHIPLTDANKCPVVHRPFLLRPGLSLDELEAKNCEISVMAQNALAGPPLEELKIPAIKETAKDAYPPLKLVKGNLTPDATPVRPENVLHRNEAEPDFPEDTP